MSEGADHNQETVERLQGELDELLRQHEQYTLALDAAMDPRTSLRLQRTLERLDDEIEGLREALKASQQPGSGTPQATEAEASSGSAILPEWEDDEPATSIYDAVGNPYVGGGAPDPMQLAASASASEEDPPTMTMSARSPSGYEPPAEPALAEPSVESVPAAPTTTVTPPVQTAPEDQFEDEDPPTISMAARVPLPEKAEPVYERPAAPPGGASFSSLPPPAADWGHTEIVPPSYDSPTPTEAEAPAAAPSSPFGSQPASSSTPAAPSPTSGSEPGSPSPFGGPPTSSPFSSSAGYDLGGDADEGEWSFGSRLLLALLVLLFLGGVGYILSQGP